MSIMPRRTLADFVCGANEKDMHFRGVNWGRDLPEPQSVDIRNAQAGDPEPNRARHPADRPRHRGGPYFSAWDSCTARP